MCGLSVKKSDRCKEDGRCGEVAVSGGFDCSTVVR